MVEVRSVSKKFGDFWALKQTDWKVSEQRSLALLGPNGAGKSTTLRILTGLLHPTEGEVLIFGQNIWQQPKSVKGKIGFLPEVPPLYDDLRVHQALKFVYGLKGLPSSRRQHHLDLVIDKLKLQEVAYRSIGQLSKGFRQRVGIAQALLGDPRLLILDEPSVGLDPHQVVELRQLIQQLKKEHVIILSSHVLSEVEQICDDVVILHKGIVRAQGSIANLLAQHQKSHLEELFLAVTQ